MTKYFKGLPYRKKNMWLAGLFVLLLLVSYSLAIHKTVEVIKNNSTIKERLVMAANAPVQIVNLENSLNELEYKFGFVNDDKLVSHEQVLNEVIELCNEHSVNLTRFPEKITEKNEDFEIQTSVVELQGNYLNIVKLVYNLERGKSGKVVSLQFALVKDIRTKKTHLLTTVYIRNITLRHHEVS